MRKPTIAALLIALLVAAASPAAADTDITGTTAGGAHYRFVVPDEWNGSLVLWNHGFSLSPPGPVSEFSPLLELQLAQGYAFGASSYRQAGWALFKSTADLRLMYQAFVARVGVPDQVILTGASLGGIVTAAAIEQGGVGNVTGALTVCGAMAGSRNWDGALDLRLLYDQICADTPAAALPGGAKGLPKNSGVTEGDVAAAVNACTGVDFKKRQRTRKQKTNLKRFKKLTGLPNEFLQTVMGYATFALADLTHARGKMRGRLGTGNADVDYGDATIDAEIERVRPKNKAARRLARNYTPTGRVGNVKIVNLHTDKDGLVIVENQGEYASVVPRGNLTVAIVRERTPTHCEITPAEGLGAWESLLDWLETGVQPTAGDIQASCQRVAPLFGGPCRIDPNFVIPSMDGRIRPRGPGGS